MYLFINTAANDRLIVALVNQSGLVLDKIDVQARFRQAEKLLPAIDGLLKRNKINPPTGGKKIKGVIVIKGPGGFTSLRIGIATANTIGYAQKIPVVGVMGDLAARAAGAIPESRFQEGMIKEGIGKLRKMKTFKAVMPEYGQEPNITLAKKL